MLTSKDIEQVKQFLREDWMNETQMPFVIEQIISFVSSGYESFLENQIKKNCNNH
ncbi:MAG: hypothetical protein ACD_71C00218G0014 [uncultured bacterium (gcode 4)]|uniref:Uncharacterized protein n=1 Tax=uncultured bacterium (gcode 4) TaxID=1234023 RepID=K2A2J4_9BACT|nr:MAG: hypothetical protein ACD_71C00218G0014 [uncultured bacterium (gcode 4)]